MKKLILTLSASIAVFSSIILSSCEKEDPDAIKMEDVNKGIQIIVGDDGNEYEVVDLGLNSGNLWAVCNMGASSPEQTGSRFAWGDVQPKTYFSWSNYRWAEGDNLSLTKYCTNLDNGTTDYKTQLEDADDAANAILGKNWHIPSSMDYEELLTNRNCTSKWCKLNGVGGYLFTSVRKGYEGNSIFIPIVGMQDNNSIRFADKWGWYWSTRIYYDTNDKTFISTDAEAFLLEHSDIDNHYMSHLQRIAGLPIRPIYVAE